MMFLVIHLLKGKQMKKKTRLEALACYISKIELNIKNTIRFSSYI